MISAAEALAASKGGVHTAQLATKTGEHDRKTERRSDRSAGKRSRSAERRSRERRSAENRKRRSRSRSLERKACRRSRSRDRDVKQLEKHRAHDERDRRELIDRERDVRRKNSRSISPKRRSKRSRDRSSSRGGDKRLKRPDERRDDAERKYRDWDASAISPDAMAFLPPTDFSYPPPNFQPQQSPLNVFGSAASANFGGGSSRSIDRSQAASLPLSSRIGMAASTEEQSLQSLLDTLKGSSSGANQPRDSNMSSVLTSLSGKADSLANLNTAAIVNALTREQPPVGMKGAENVQSALLLKLLVDERERQKQQQEDQQRLLVKLLQEQFQSKPSGGFSETQPRVIDYSHGESGGSGQIGDVQSLRQVPQLQQFMSLQNQTVLQQKVGQSTPAEVFNRNLFEKEFAPPHAGFSKQEQDLLMDAARNVFQSQTQQNVGPAYSWQNQQSVPVGQPPNLNRNVIADLV